MDIGRKMASRHYVAIDGVPCVDFTSQWLPPTASFLKHLPAGEHSVSVLADDQDAPVLYWDAAQDRTQWRSPVATALDYVVIAGPEADQIMAGYRQLCGETPLFPLWAYGYIHCRERFTSQAEILDTTREFRRRNLPIDVMVQDWQYWGKYGWNAMRFDEEQYPDPAGMVKDLHALNARLMLSVWAKLPKSTQLGKEAAEKGYIIPGTEWVDFFNPNASTFYTENQNKRLATLGIDAWWQDATEPENDDLEGRMTAAGAGERVRNVYPLQITQAVYNSQRQFAPGRRVMILTRSAAIGQQRYAAATWSGDIGSDWETLKRQIPAGLNMAAAGYPYWTVDGGGFFRPGKGNTPTSPIMNVSCAGFSTAPSCRFNGCTAIRPKPSFGATATPSSPCHVNILNCATVSFLTFIARPVRRGAQVFPSCARLSLISATMRGLLRKATPTCSGVACMSHRF